MKNLLILHSLHQDQTSPCIQVPRLLRLKPSLPRSVSACNVVNRLGYGSGQKWMNLHQVPFLYIEYIVKWLNWNSLESPQKISVRLIYIERWWRALRSRLRDKKRKRKPPPSGSNVDPGPLCEEVHGLRCLSPLELQDSLRDKLSGSYFAFLFLTHVAYSLGSIKIY